MRNENQNIEYKESWRDEYLKWICGFANTNGGKLYIGVDDEGHVVGVPQIKRLLEDVPNKIANMLGIVCDVNLLTDKAGYKYVEIIVSPSNMPVSYKGQYHYRSGSTKQELKGVSLQQFIMKKMGKSWDDLPIEDATIEDIDREAIDYFLRQGISAGRIAEDEKNSSTEDVLKNLGFFTSDGKLKTAAILLFGKHIRQFFPAADFKIGRFHTDESDLVTQDLIECNIIQMASRVVSVLRSKYLISPIHYERMQRVEELEIPEKALRELIYNAIAHKDYTGPSIQMRVYDDSIELWNYGLLPAELTTEDLMNKHASYPRNKNLAYAFFKAGFIESWGRGFKKIREEFDRIHYPMPQIREMNGGVMVILKRRSIDEIIALRDEQNMKNGGNGGGNVAVMNLTNRQKLIVTLIMKKPSITAKQMAVMTDIPQRTIERELSVLQRAEIIRHIGSPRTGAWVIVIPEKEKLS